MKFYDIDIVNKKIILNYVIILLKLTKSFVDKKNYRKVLELVALLQ